MKIRYTSQRLIFAAVGMLAAMPMAGRAAESPLPITPPGATDTDQATLPPFSGFYGGAVALPFNQNIGTYDENGKLLPPQEQLHARANIYAPVLIYVYPFHPFGGTVASVFVQPVENLNYSFGTSGRATNQFNLGDAYSDIFYWTKNVGLLGAEPGPIPMAYGLSVGTGFALVIPDGNYNSRDALKLSGHAWVPDPNIALTYNTGPKWSLGNNTQVSGRMFYAIPQRDFTTGFKTGNIVDVDYAITQQFGPLRVGVAGYYEAQTTDDDPGNGVKLPNGNKFTLAGMGPVIQYFIPSLNAFIKAKYNRDFVHKNAIDPQALVLSVGLKF